MKQIIAILLTLTLFLSIGCKHEIHQNATFRQIDSYLSELEKIGFSGSVLVDIKGLKILSKGYGFSDKEKQLKNSPNTIFDIGSVTKQFTAAAILKLEMQGKLSTEDELSKYFDNVPKDKGSITLHDLLRHQSGLTSSVGKDYEKISQEDFLKKVFSSPLRFEVGTDFSYSNIGYSLLAMIIEKVSGKSYENYLYDNLWKPAQMETTGYTRPKFDTNLIAAGYYGDGRIWGKPIGKEWDKIAPYWHLAGNGGILSTTEDLYRWNKALEGEQILSKKVKEKFYRPKLRNGENESSIYAYGWDVSKTGRNTTRVWHNGTNHIFYADFLKFIDEDVTLIMLSNKSHPNFNELTFEISMFIFYPYYQLSIPVEDNETTRGFTAYIIKTLTDSGIEKAKEAYQKREKKENLLEFLMREEGFRNLDDHKPDIATRIFEMNVFVHPNSAKALQGLGEGYMETGRKELALKYFMQSQHINPENRFVNSMISKLEE